MAGSGTAPLYPVQHPKYGDVGTYTNTIEKAADSTTVSTQGRIQVSVLGIPAYRQSFDRVERWNGPSLAKRQRPPEPKPASALFTTVNS